MRVQLVILEKLVGGVGEDCLSPRMAAQVRGHIKDAIEVGVKGSVLTLSGSTFQNLLNHIFGDDGLAAMGTILRRIGLRLKTQRARPFRFVRSQSRYLTDFVPG